jgi:peptidoglycan/xylan/chitin deacetylase (PgdA/CDA1 family)
MTKYTVILAFAILSSVITCGYSQSELVFTGTYNGSFHPFDSILVQNINTGGRVIKIYPDTVLTLLIKGTDEHLDNSVFSLSQNYPNPFDEETHFTIHLPRADLLILNIFSMTGKLVLNYEQSLSSGNHTFVFRGSMEKIYILSVKTRDYSSSIKMMNITASKNRPATLEYIGEISSGQSSKKGDGGFEYNTGDRLVFKGYMSDRPGSILSYIITDIPIAGSKYSFNFKKTARIVILTYHRITDSIPSDEYDRTRTDFENDLIYIRDHNFMLLSMDDLLLYKDGDLKLNYDGIIITFDDGYESNYSIAYPLLTTYKMPATFFLTTEWIDTPGFTLWSEVWLMSQYTDPDDKKPFVMGSHTSSHPYLEQSEPDFATHQDYLDFLNTELGDSKIWITDITGQPTMFLALPYGDGANNQDIINVAQEKGYSGIRTSVWDSFVPGTMDIYALPCIPVLSDTPIESIENYFNK